MTDDITAATDLGGNLPQGAEADAFDVVRVLPGLHIMLQPQEPFAILEASDTYLAATRTNRDEIVGRPFFDVFRSDPEDPDADGERNVHASFQRIISTGESDRIPVQRYPIPRPEAEGGGLDERYWQPWNTPVHGREGQLRYLLHRIVDVTEEYRQNRRLQRASDLLRIAERTAHIGGWAVNLDTGDSEWSDSVCDICGVPQGSTPGPGRP